MALRWPHFQIRCFSWSLQNFWSSQSKLIFFFLTLNSTFINPHFKIHRIKFQERQWSSAWSSQIICLLVIPTIILLHFNAQAYCMAINMAPLLDPDGKLCSLPVLLHFCSILFQFTAPAVIWGVLWTRLSKAVKCSVACWILVMQNPCLFWVSELHYSSSLVHFSGCNLQTNQYLYRILFL